MANTFEQNLENEQATQQGAHDIAFNDGVEVCVDTVLGHGGLDNITASHVRDLLYSLKIDTTVRVNYVDEDQQPTAANRTVKVRPNIPLPGAGA